MGLGPVANVREGEGVSLRVSFRFSPRFVPSGGTESLELETLRSETSGLMSGRDRLRLNFKRILDGHTFLELLIKESRNVAPSQKLGQLYAVFIALTMSTVAGNGSRVTCAS
jgi:hypothetical protein